MQTKTKKNKEEKKKVVGSTRVRPAEERAIGQDNSVKQITNAWDQMIIAKHFPGKFQSPYVSDMNISSQHTGIVESSIIVNQAYDQAGNLIDLELNDYQVIMFLPSATVLNGPGGAGNIGTTTKLGGYYHVMTSLTTSDIASVAHFYQVNKGAYAMGDLYGSQGDTIAQNAFIWSSTAKFQLLGANANLCGTVKLGHFTLSSLQGYDAGGGITINDLLKAVHTTVSLKAARGQFQLTSAVVNHSIAQSMARGIDTTTLTEAALFGGEVIAFAIIEKPYISISTGVAAQWTMNVDISSNYAYMPKLWDAFSRSLGTEPELANENTGNKQYVMYGKRPIIRLPTLEYDPVAAHGLTRFLPRTMLDAYHKIRNFYGSNRNWLDPVISGGLQLARMAAYSTDVRALEEDELVNVGILRSQLLQVISSFRGTPLESRYAIDLMRRDLKALNTANSRFLTVSQLPSSSFENVLKMK